MCAESKFIGEVAQCCPVGFFAVGGTRHPGDIEEFGCGSEIRSVLFWVSLGA